MSLPASIGPYTVEREIGRGGMGVVYLGKDPRLDRAVAIKALPDDLASQPDRVARFEREARSLAALHHPNIASLFGLEQGQGDNAHHRYLILEYVEGDTLADRLAKGPLPVDEALAIAAQIAAAVEAAHEAGIVHRDLKPANVKITPAGAVKVLDFGLANGDAARASSAVDITSLPTALNPKPAVTAAGLVMGTAAYMSPEQARGRPVDRRTDIWALGCVLYECLTADSPFAAETTSDSIAAVLERDPDWSRLPARTPPRVRSLLVRCLEKDARNRLRDVGDARIELEHALRDREWTSTSAFPAAPQPNPLRKAALPAAALALAAVSGFLGFKLAPHPTPPPSTTPPLRVSINLPKDAPASGTYGANPVALSPDGHTLAYVARLRSGTPQILLRKLDSFDCTPLPGSQGAETLAFSPDGQWIAFAGRLTSAATHATIAKVQLAGGPPVTILDHLPNAVNCLQWPTQDRLYYISGLASAQILSVPAQGGPPSSLFEPKDAANPSRFSSICVPPNAPYLFATTSFSDEKGFHEATLRITPATKDSKIILDSGAFPRLLNPSTLLYTFRDGLFARPINPATGDFTAGPTPILSGLYAPISYNSCIWDLSASGDLVFLPGGITSGKRHIVRADLDGKNIEPVTAAPEAFEGTVSASPDGAHLAGTIVSESGSYDLFVLTLADKTLRRLPVPGADAGFPVWNPDNHHLIYAAYRAGGLDRVYSRPIDDSAPPKVIFEQKDPKLTLAPNSISPEGHTLLLTSRNADSGSTALLTLDLQHPGQAPAPLFPTLKDPSYATFSPDGQWISYQSEEGGSHGLYLRPNPHAPNPPTVERITIASGVVATAFWNANGDTLFYLNAQGQLRSVTYKSTPNPTLTPRPEFLDTEDAHSLSNLFPTPDGKHLYYVRQGDDEIWSGQANLIQGLGSEIRAKLNAARP